MKKKNIDIVYHAAAYKHVTIVENSDNSEFSFTNNLLITNNLVKLSSAYLIKHLVLISSDKAVEPSNLMGLSKRISEIITQNQSHNSSTNFKIVRFGNVIGSSGSVINNFINQFNEGGPLTLTDKKAERFFMSINEAASLVIETIIHGKSGNILYLDMGKAINIYDILKKLAISYNKIIVEKKPNSKNEILLKIIGLQKGEKIKEKLYFDNEKDISKSINKKINIINSKPLFNDDIQNLIDDFTKKKNCKKLIKLLNIN